MKFYGLKSCDTCRKALKDLRAAGVEPEVVDVRTDGIPKADLEQIIAVFGDAAINRRSTTWRELTEDERGQDPLALLSAHPTLMKRPVIDADGALFQGWTKDVKTALITQ